MSDGIDPRLSGREGDPPQPPREAFTAASMGAYLDSPAGAVLAMLHGGGPAGRAAAQAELIEQSNAAEKQRREQAELLYAANPGRYGSVGEAMTRISYPGGGAYMQGPAADLERVSRRTPGAGWVVSPEPVDTTTRVGLWADESGAVVDDPGLTAPPWARG